MMEFIDGFIRGTIAFILSLLWCMFVMGCGGKLAVDAWDRKRSDVCEDWEELEGSCRDGRGALVHYRVDMP